MVFSSIDDAEYSKIKTDWLARLVEAEHEVYRADYQQLFGMIEGSKAIGDIDGRTNEPVHYAVSDVDGACQALVQIVQSKRGREVWVKMLDIFLSPGIELAPDDESNTQLRLSVFREALKGIFGLTTTSKLADTVKVYGRTDALVTFLRGMHDSFSVIASLGTLKGVEVSIEGRWLVFRAI